MKIPEIVIRLNSEQVNDYNLKEGAFAASILRYHMWSPTFMAVCRIRIILPLVREPAYYTLVRKPIKLSEFPFHSYAENNLCHRTCFGIAYWKRIGLFNWHLHISTERWQHVSRGNGYETSSAGIWFLKLEQRLTIAAELKNVIAYLCSGNKSWFPWQCATITNDMRTWILQSSRWKRCLFWSLQLLTALLLLLAAHSVCTSHIIS